MKKINKVKMTKVSTHGSLFLKEFNKKSVKNVDNKIQFFVDEPTNKKINRDQHYLK